MADRFTVLHHGGNDLDNPILEDQTLTIVLHKQDDDQLLKKCFVVVDGEIHADLTAQCVETREEITLNVTAGVELVADFPAKKNVIHFTTTPHLNSRQVVYVATQPNAMVTLDGYNCDDPTEPLIYPIYRTS